MPPSNIIAFHFPQRNGVDTVTTMVELLDGSFLAFEDSMAPNARREIEAWALVPDGRTVDTARDSSVWKGALDAGPLLYVAFTGVIGGAAWSVFPAAAKYLRRVISKDSAQLDASGAGDRSRRAVVAALGLSDDGGLIVEKVRRDAEGTWRSIVRCADGREVSVRMDSSGSVTHVRLRQT